MSIRVDDKNRLRAPDFFTPGEEYDVEEPRPGLILLRRMVKTPGDAAQLAETRWRTAYIRRVHGCLANDCPEHGPKDARLAAEAAALESEIAQARPGTSAPKPATRDPAAEKVGASAPKAPEVPVRGMSWPVNSRPWVTPRYLRDLARWVMTQGHVWDGRRREVREMLTEAADAHDTTKRPEARTIAREKLLARDLAAEKPLLAQDFPGSFGLALHRALHEAARGF